VGGDINILSRTNNTAYQAFHPFTQEPVQGVHWDYGANFGKVTGVNSYQQARLFNFSVGSVLLQQKLPEDRVIRLPHHGG